MSNSRNPVRHGARERAWFLCKSEAVAGVAEDGLAGLDSAFPVRNKRKECRAIAARRWSFWSSSQNNNNNAWNQRFSDGNQDNNNKNNNNCVRAVRGFAQRQAEEARYSRASSVILEFVFMEKTMQFDVPLEDVFEAYYDCRKHKRNKSGALQFEVNLEENVISLWRSLCDGTYAPQASTVFIVEKPVVREVFAASFRDRIVHHLLLRYLNPLFERYFIYDSYACREQKGTHFGIKRAACFIKECSDGGQKSCWILKMDIRSFFMSINRKRLYENLSVFIDANYHEKNVAFVKHLCRTVIFNDPTKQCIFKSPAHKWNGLAQGKSLFSAREDCGLPIGNFTSQVFANFYLSSFDHFIKHECGVRYYGRYVDDCIFVHESKQFLKHIAKKAERFLSENLLLAFNPGKLYLQHYRHGVRFLGCFIKPSHTVVNYRTVNNFKQKIARFNALAIEHKPDKQERDSFISSVNSYLGCMKHYKTFRMREKILFRCIHQFWFKQISVFGKSEKIIRRNV